MGRDPGARRLARITSRGALLLASLLTAACGGGGGGDSDALPCTALSFDRALVTPGNGDVYLETSSVTCSTLGISVVVNNLDGIWTAEFDLTFPTSLLSYDSYTLGPLLQKGSPLNAPFVQVNEVGNAVRVVVTRFNPDPTVNAVGSESLITLRFSRVAPGSGAIDFDTSGTSPVAERILDNMSSTPLPATFAPGHGGLVTVP